MLGLPPPERWSVLLVMQANPTQMNAAISTRSYSARDTPLDEHVSVETTNSLTQLGRGSTRPPPEAAASITHPTQPQSIFVSP